MKINKKCEGTASTFLIASLIAVGMLLAIGAGIQQLGARYSAPENPYFAPYEETYADIGDVSGDYVGEYDGDLNDTKTNELRQEDNMFLKAFKIVSNLGDLLGGITKGIRTLGTELQIPGAFTAMVLSVLGIVLITALVKIFRGFKHV